LTQERKYHISENETPVFDAAIVGGGLAGLSLSILLAKKGFKVILFEKEKYPFHKVCGEYISMGSWKFIEALGVDLSHLQLPVIKNLIVSAPNGSCVTSKLDMGGFGISRYFLDNKLKEIALAKGVEINDSTKVSEVLFEQENFTIKFKSEKVRATFAAGAFGKRSNLDVKWKRDFIKRKNNKLNNYIGVKYHISTSFPADTIALHNFKNGYCCISKVESDKYCLCYLTTAENLKQNNNSIKEMEKNVLYKNIFLKNIFCTADFLFAEPVVISQISFDKKSKIEDHILMLGDAAGMITPLCGNGMSMALHSAKIAAGAATLFLEKKISREEMENKYIGNWDKQFNKRLKYGRRIQRLFGKEIATNFFIRIVRYFPFVVRKLIKSTHGEEF
jgi:flavin-dependent dehydrogenase